MLHSSVKITLFQLRYNLCLSMADRWVRASIIKAPLWTYYKEVWRFKIYMTSYGLFMKNYHEDAESKEQIGGRTLHFYILIPHSNAIISPASLLISHKNAYWSGRYILVRHCCVQYKTGALLKASCTIMWHHNEPIFFVAEITSNYKEMIILMCCTFNGNYTITVIRNYEM